MALSPLARSLTYTCVGLGVLFLFTLGLVWLYQHERWDPTAVVVAATVFGAGAIIVIGVVGLQHNRPPPPPSVGTAYRPSSRPVDYIR